MPAAEMDVGGDIEFTVDADEEEEEPAPAAVEDVDAAEPSAELIAEQRRLKRLHNMRRRQRAEHVHRTSLLCWLSHGRLLSDQADDEILQGTLLSLVPQELLAAVATDGLEALLRVAVWLRTYLRDEPAAAAAAVAAAGRGRGGGRGRGRGAIIAAADAGYQPSGEPLARCERSWMLTRLVERGARANAPPAWAAAAAPAAYAALLDPSSLEAGVAPLLVPPLRDAATTATAIEAVAAQLTGDLTGEVAPHEPALRHALALRDGTPSQRLLLLAATYRACGVPRRLVLVLQPPPNKPPPDGKRHAQPSRAVARLRALPDVGGGLL